jgi:hypothetical protein
MIEAIAAFGSNQPPVASAGFLQKMGAIANRLLLAIIVAGAIAACDDRSEREQREHAARRTAELSLMTDISRAAPEIERRLRERVQSDGKMIFVKERAGDRFLSLQAMPVTVTWIADCGLVGLSVSFGDVGESGNGTEIRLSDASFDEPACRTLLPIAAAKVGQVLSGN